MGVPGRISPVNKKGANKSVSRPRKEICQKQTLPLPKLGVWRNHISAFLPKRSLMRRNDRCCRQIWRDFRSLDLPPKHFCLTSLTAPVRNVRNDQARLKRRRGPGRDWSSSLRRYRDGNRPGQSGHDLRYRNPASPNANNTFFILRALRICVLRRMFRPGSTWTWTYRALLVSVTTGIRRARFWRCAIDSKYRRWHGRTLSLPTAETIRRKHHGPMKRVTIG
jgi:hypothetical protein